MFSVIIPSFDEEKYIGNLIAELCSQDFKDLEIIICDACSDDNTKQVVAAFKKRYYWADITFIELKERNVSKQRNVAASLARHEFLIFLDADISLKDSSFLSKVKALCDKSGLSVAGLKVKVDAQRIIDRFFNMVFSFSINVSHLLGIPASRGCIIVRKKAFDKIKGFDENLAVAEDIDLFRRLAIENKPVYPDIAVYESPRRFQKQGYMKTIFVWAVNGLWAFLFNRNLIKSYKPVR